MKKVLNEKEINLTVDMTDEEMNNVMLKDSICLNIDGTEAYIPCDTTVETFIADYLNKNSKFYFAEDMFGLDFGEKLSDDELDNKYFLEDGADKANIVSFKTNCGFFGNHTTLASATLKDLYMQIKTIASIETSIDWWLENDEYVLPFCNDIADEYRVYEELDMRFDNGYINKEFDRPEPVVLNDKNQKKYNKMLSDRIRNTVISL